MATEPVGGSAAPKGEPEIRVVYSAAEIEHRVAELARAVAAADSERLLVVPILTGSFVFAADLMRGLHKAGLSVEVDFMTLSSYRKSASSSGKVDILRDLEMDVAGRNVLVVDDVLESGRTLAFAKDLIAARGARRIATCVLIDKQVPRAVQIRADFVGFQSPPIYLVGYGMDLAYRFRELPYVGQIVTPSSAGA